MEELKVLNDIRALLLMERARHLREVAENARTPADLRPEDPTRLTWRAALECAVEELEDAKKAISPPAG